MASVVSRHPDASVERVKFARYGQWLVARAEIRNTRANWWAPAARVRFAALDPRGHVIATYLSMVTLRPARTVSVIAPSFLIPLAAGPVSRVTVRVAPGAWSRSASYTAPHVKFSAFQIRRGDHRFLVSGDVLHNGGRQITAVIGCNGRDRRGHLTGAAVSRVVIPAHGTVDVSTHIPHAALGTVTGGCRVMGWTRA